MLAPIHPDSPAIHQGAQEQGASAFALANAEDVDLVSGESAADAVQMQLGGNHVGIFSTASLSSGGLADADGEGRGGKRVAQVGTEVRVGAQALFFAGFNQRREDVHRVSSARTVAVKAYVAASRTHAGPQFRGVVVQGRRRRRGTVNNCSRNSASVCSLKRNRVSA